MCVGMRFCLKSALWLIHLLLNDALVLQLRLKQGVFYLKERGRERQKDGRGRENIGYIYTYIYI